MNLEKILSDFERHIESMRKKWSIPGLSVGISAHGETIYAEGFGVRNLGQKKAVTAETIFPIGSVTKSFTATLMAMLIAEGRLNWRDKVIDFLSTFKLYDPWITQEFTIEDLFAQRSGLPPYAGLYLPFFGFDQHHIIEALRYLKPVSSFRAGFSYQNNFYLAAAKIIEDITGRSWQENLKKRILTPLKMFDSFAGADAFKKAANTAYLHKKHLGKLAAAPKNWPHLKAFDALIPAGGMYSSVSDLLKWINFQFENVKFRGKPILAEKEKSRLHDPHTVVRRRQWEGRELKKSSLFCGLGWFHEESRPFNIISHGGVSQGSVALAAFVPEEKLGIAVLANSHEALSLPFILMKHFYDNYFGNPKKDWEKIFSEEFSDSKKPVRKSRKKSFCCILPEQCVGNYFNEVYGKVTITRQNRKLILTIGPRKIKFMLSSCNGNIYKLDWPNKKKTISPAFLDDPEFVIFDKDAAGHVTRMTIKFLQDQDGTGIFNKK